MEKNLAKKGKKENLNAFLYAQRKSLRNTYDEIQH